jgi:hypothetical protein
MKKILHSRLSLFLLFVLINLVIGAIFFFAIKVFFDDSYTVSQAEDIVWPLFAISLVLPLLVLMPYGIGFFYKKFKGAKIEEEVTSNNQQQQAVLAA